MADIASDLMIKYGLSRPPSDQSKRTWAQRTDSIMSRGHDPEAAGRIAAQETFSDYRTRVYESQGATILALLALARKK
jgi:hypothetical protein